MSSPARENFHRLKKTHMSGTADTVPCSFRLRRPTEISAAAVSEYRAGDKDGSPALRFSSWWRAPRAAARGFLRCARLQGNVGELWVSALIVLVLGGSAPSHAHEVPPAPAAMPSNQQPEILKNVRLEPTLGAQLPLQTHFSAADGANISLQDYFKDKPALLVFSYFNCQTLCPLILDGLVAGLKPLSLQPGRDFNVIVISIDDRDKPALAQERKIHYLGRYGRSDEASGWHFLTGTREAIQRVTEAAGFQFSYDAARGEYAHASGVYALTPEGKIARVFYGVDFAPRDLRLSLVEASNHKIGTPIDQLMLYCYHYDAHSGKYSLVVMNTLRLTGSATVLALASFILCMVRRDRNGQQKESEA